MYIFTNLLIVLVVFVFMEFLAWFTHKYVMHGILWKLHEDHHVPHDHTLEVNDFFALIFAVPSILLIFSGTWYENGFLISAGIGILLYGLAYFFVHDLYVHRRIRISWLQRLDNNYLRAIHIAHKRHHKYQEKNPGESYGFLWVGKKYRQMALRSKK